MTVQFLGRTICAVAYDVDGTLYRQLPVRTEMSLRLGLEAMRRGPSGPALLQAISTFRGELERQRLFASTAADPYELALLAAARRSGLSVEHVRQDVHTWMLQNSLPAIARWRRPGLARFVQLARARGLAQGVLSDLPAAAKLAALGLDHAVVAVLRAGDPQVGPLKPSPQAFLTLAGRLGTLPEHLLYIGDRADVDALGARGAGALAVLMGRTTRSSREPHCFRDFDELAEAWT